MKRSRQSSGTETPTWLALRTTTSPRSASAAVPVSPTTSPRMS